MGFAVTQSPGVGKMLNKMAFPAADVSRQGAICGIFDFSSLREEFSSNGEPL
jgi:hypothetical protein